MCLMRASLTRLSATWGQSLPPVRFTIISPALRVGSGMYLALDKCSLCEQMSTDGRDGHGQCQPPLPVLKAYTALGAEHTTKPKEAVLKPLTSRCRQCYGKVCGERFANTQAQRLF